MGNQAIALGALRAGVNLVCGYPGTPSTEVLETLAARNPGSVHVEWSTNEKAALEVAIGASFAGARTLVTMKQVGLNVASDPLMSLVYLGVKGGMVLLVADDPGPISSQTEQDTRQFAQFAKVPVFDPATPEEAFAMVQEAFELSEKFETPVILRPTTRVCHGSAALDIELRYTPHAISGFERDLRWVVFPRRVFEGHLQTLERLSLITTGFDSYERNLVETIVLEPAEARDAGDEDEDEMLPIVGKMREIRERALNAFGFNRCLPVLGIAAGGISHAYLRDALALLQREQALALEQPLALRLFKVATPFPFPEQRALAFLDGLDEVLVFEELEPVIERELLLLAGKHHLPVTLRGKLTHDTTLAGENSVSTIAEQIVAWLERVASPGLSPAVLPAAASPAAAASAAAASPEVAPPLPVRPPVLCAGCPHRGAFAAVKRALRGHAATFSGDIGCYTLGNALPLDMVDTCVCMGAGFTVTQGLQWAEPDVLHLGFVGDSTFFASGLTGVANAVYNQADVTLFVLDNSTTAMTGSQPHPGTGLRMSSDASERDAANALRIPAVLQALGVAHVAIANPFDFATSVATVTEAVAVRGVSAVVFKAPCITVSKPRPQPSVNAQRCTLCRACINTLGCPALVVRPSEAAQKGSTVAVDATLCYGCDLCVQLCAFGAIERQVMPDA
jgi:indolepyruvate ferredoxin oxidoreductase alpha subunit